MVWYVALLIAKVYFYTLILSMLVLCSVCSALIIYEKCPFKTVMQQAARRLGLGLGLSRRSQKSAQRQFESVGTHTVQSTHRAVWPALPRLRQPFTVDSLQGKIFRFLTFFLGIQLHHVPSTCFLRTKHRPNLVVVVCSTLE